MKKLNAKGKGINCPCNSSRKRKTDMKKNASKRVHQYFKKEINAGA